MEFRGINHELMKRRMEAEMNKFEEEISKPIARPPGPNMPNQSLYQFIPHQIQRQVPSLNRPVGAHSLAVPLNSDGSPHVKGFNRVNGPSQPYTVSPMELPPGVTAASLNQANIAMTNTATTSNKRKNTEKSQPKVKKALRMAGGQIWEDSSLLEWDPDDFRLFVGDLGNDVTDEVLTRGFSKYPSFVKAKVVRDKRTNKSKGYGFVSFKDPQDYIRAMREMDGKYLGSRPIKLRKSTWKERSLDVVKKKNKEKAKVGPI